MKARLLGSFITVRASVADVSAFARQWPGCELNSAIGFEFQASNLDLVDMWPKRHSDSEGIMGLLEDCQEYARKHLAKLAEAEALKGGK